jgi:hypothetical protein
VLPPDGHTRTLNPDAWPVVVDGTGEPGAYKLTSPGGRTAYFAVRNDAREAILTPNTDADRQRVADAVGGMNYVSSTDEIVAGGGGQPVAKELWWVLLLLVLAFLAVEVFYTRRLTDRGEHNVKLQTQG